MISNRREMLWQAAGALTGLAAIGCGLVSHTFAQAPQRRREVVVNGKRVRTVDLHAHCHVPEANALMGLKVQLQSLVVSPERIKAMDEQGIDIEALSLNPIFWNKAEPDLAGQVVKLQNEKLAAQGRVGGLRQEAVRRAAGPARLLVALHPPGRHLQSPADLRRRGQRHVHVEGLPDRKA